MLPVIIGEKWFTHTSVVSCLDAMPADGLLEKSEQRLFDCADGRSIIADRIIASRELACGRLPRRDYGSTSARWLRPSLSARRGYRLAEGENKTIEIFDDDLTQI